MAFRIGTLFAELEYIGFFDYVLPFLIVFAIVFAVLEKSSWLGSNKAVKTIVSASVGLLSTWGLLTTEFYKIIFPYMGVGLGVILVALIFLGFFIKDDTNGQKWWPLGLTLAAIIIIWTLSSWNLWGGYGAGGFWDIISYYWPALVGVGLLVWALMAITGGDKSGSTTSAV
jgi:hypothetical protein